MQITTEKEEKIKTLIREAESELKEDFAFADEISEYNQEKVIDAFAKNGVALRHFNGSSGYGIGDEGRHVLGQTFADAMGAESGIVSPALLSGTHTLAVALFGLLRPGDRALAVTGLPYDTLRGVIFGKDNGSLKELGVRFDLLDLNAEGSVDFPALENRLQNAGEDLKMIYIQRSRGYELETRSPWRKSAKSVRSSARTASKGLFSSIIATANSSKKKNLATLGRMSPRVRSSKIPAAVSRPRADTSSAKSNISKESATVLRRRRSATKSARTLTVTGCSFRGFSLRRTSLIRQ